MKVKPSSGPRFAPSHFAAEPVPAMRPCPRCGREMLLFVTYYECPACLYIERKPSRYQPDRNKRRNRLLAALHRALPGWAHALHERDPLLMHPPVSYELAPELSFERQCLLFPWLALCAVIFAFCEDIISGLVSGGSTAIGAFAISAVVALVTIPYLLYTTAPTAKLIGFSLSLLAAVVCAIALIWFYTDVVAELAAEGFSGWIATLGLPVAAGYGLWFASFMNRALARLHESS